MTPIRFSLLLLVIPCSLIVSKNVDTTSSAPAIRTMFGLIPYRIAESSVDTISITPSIQAQLARFAAAAYSTVPTLYNSFQIAGYCIQNNIEGDFVECGVAAGAQVAAMAYAGQLLNKPRVIHLFDSFEGIPLAGPNDTQQPGVGPITHNTNVKNLNDLLVSSGITCHSLESVKANMKQWGIDESWLIYYKGWFQYTFPLSAHKINKISFLRLDGDLYESTKICLEYFYPKVVTGGFVVIDDYSSLTGCRKAVDEYLKKNNLHPKITLVENGGGPVYWQVD